MDVPNSCDTFVVLPPLTKNGIIFGKNSHGEPDEVHEVVYLPSSDQQSGPVKCTYLEISPSPPSKSVILNKLGWMWGAEMGANDCGVAIGLEDVKTKGSGDGDKENNKLLGGDLVRLGLERGSSAAEALDVITGLLQQYGQGGVASKKNCARNFFASFLIADAAEAWVLETSGKHWAAEKITSGFRNISNCLTISTKIDRHSDGLQDYAKEQGYWNGEGDFNFTEIFGVECDTSRYEAGKELLASLTIDNEFRETDMFNLLRNKEALGCKCQSSQVSTLSSTKPSVHWFTATPDPSLSVYKPFVFTSNVSISQHTKCPDDDLDAPHTLFALHKHSADKQDSSFLDLLRNMEAECVKELDDVIENIGDDLSELDELLKDCVETEVKFYR